jgi:opacity protein-like surface antigen
MKSKKLLMAAFFLVSVLAAPLANANTGFNLAANIAKTTTSGYGNSSDFGFTAGYDLNPSLGLEVGYESLMGYEMTMWSVSGLGRYHLTNHLSLLGRLGLAHWTESPTGRHNATGTNPLLGLGLSYALTPAMSIRTEYQFVPNSGGLGTSLDTLLLGINWHF